MSVINKIKAFRYKYLKQFQNKKIKQGIQKYLHSNPNIPYELKKALEFYRTNDIQTFPYDFVQKYRNQKFDLKFEGNSFFIKINGNKMYFREDWLENSCQAYLKTLHIEQDAESPHSYCSNDFTVCSDEILIDIGAAEGYFSYLNCYKAKKIYSFEMDQKWITALKKGFDENKEKLMLFPGRIGNSNRNGNYKLDDFGELFNDKLFIKMDVEGSEREVFEGMTELLKTNQNIKIAVCTYHKKHDANDFENLLKNLGFKTSFSEGYMLYQYAKDLTEPYLRKGVLRAWK